MSVRLIVRLAAVAIAVLGLLDPAVTVDRPAPVSVAVVVANGGDAAGRQEAASRVRDALVATGADAHVRHTTRADAVMACGAGESCIAVGPPMWPGPWESDGRFLGAVVVDEPAPAVAIEDVESSGVQVDGAAGQMRLYMRRRDAGVGTFRIDVLDDGILVGHTEGAWGEGDVMAVDVPWWPVATGPRRLTVRAASNETGASVEADSVDVAVTVGAPPLNVLVYEPRPSWGATFVRRAIEDDVRLAVRLQARLGPRVSVAAGEPFRLDAASLDEASVVVVGAVDALSAGDVNLLERFVRVRGGSLVLLPDSAATGAARRLLPVRGVERPEANPVDVGVLKGRELLLFPDVRPTDVVLARAGETPAVVASAAGDGMVVVSGVMDAWRYRDEGEGAFDAMWRSLVADLAARAGRRVEVEAVPAMARPGQRVAVRARVHSMTPGDAVDVAGTLTCGDGQARPLRLWPEAAGGDFAAAFTAAAGGPCRVDVSAALPVTESAAANVMVGGDARAVASGGIDMGRLAAAWNAPVVAAGDEARLARLVEERADERVVPAAVRPMRSAWWIVPFAACLGVEWWLRRRRGLR